MVGYVCLSYAINTEDINPWTIKSYEIIWSYLL